LVGGGNGRKLPARGKSTPSLLPSTHKSLRRERGPGGAFSLGKSARRPPSISTLKKGGRKGTRKKKPQNALSEFSYATWGKRIKVRASWLKVGGEKRGHAGKASKKAAGKQVGKKKDVFS